jgi:hypothetical protein
MQDIDIKNWTQFATHGILWLSTLMVIINLFAMCKEEFWICFECNQSPKKFRKREGRSKGLIK